MGDEKTKVVEGVNLSGEKRRYTFKLLTPKAGLIVWHEFALACFQAAPLLVKAVPMVFRFLNKLEEAEKTGEAEVTFKITDLGPEGLQLLTFLAEVVTPIRLEMLCTEMLAGTKVEYEEDGKSISETIDATGVGQYTAGNPLEVYVSLFYAIQANYPKVLAPLSEMVSMGRDMLADASIPDTEKTSENLENKNKNDET